MAKKAAATGKDASLKRPKRDAELPPDGSASRPYQRPSALVDTRVIYCGDCLDQLRKLPDACVDLTYIDPPFNSNRNYEVFWGETKEKRAFEDRHGSTLMRTMLHTLRACCLSVMLASAAISLYAQGTAFTYQGRLNDSGNRASGAYDLRFTIYDSTNNPGSVVAGPLTNAAVGVSNGLFTAMLDFGGGVFTGADRWLEIGVRSNGGSAFTTLSPRQTLTPAPYAIYAGGVSAAGISGTIPAGNIGSGTITSNMLAPGAAVANLAVPGATLLSTDPNATNLAATGYTRVGGPWDLAWQERSTRSAPPARQSHTAVWTGNEMIVWGGVGSGSFNDGGRYDPATGAWSPIPTNGAPIARANHTAVWTGTEMIVWGGAGNSGYFDDGGRYNLATNIWSPVTTSSAPSARNGHTAVWTRTGMIVWGGFGSGFFGDGRRYNPATSIWSSITTNGTPSARSGHTAVWTGSEMIVWGGGIVSGTSPSLRYTNFNDGARYNPTTDIWSPVTTNGAPAARQRHAAVWTGTEMLVWGGDSTSWDGSSHTYFQDGGRYNPATGTWSPIAVTNAPIARFWPTAVWTGTEMIVWGGGNNIGQFNDGGRYNPAIGNWFPVTTLNAPLARLAHTAVWTGSEMIVFGGTATDVVAFGDTWAYAPSRVIYLYLRP